MNSVEGSSQVRVLSVDDHPLLREGIAAIIEAQPELVLVAQAATGGEAVRQVHAGKKRVPAEVAAQLAEHMGFESLTAREIEVLRHIADGNRNRDIAERLFISEETVKVHVKHI